MSYAKLQTAEGLVEEFYDYDPFFGCQIISKRLVVASSYGLAKMQQQRQQFREQMELRERIATLESKLKDVAKRNEG